MEQCKGCKKKSSKAGPRQSPPPLAKKPAKRRWVGKAMEKEKEKTTRVTITARSTVSDKETNATTIRLAIGRHPLKLVTPVTLHTSGTDQVLLETHMKQIYIYIHIYIYLHAPRVGPKMITIACKTEYFLY